MWPLWRPLLSPESLLITLGEELRRWGGSCGQARPVHAPLSLSMEAGGACTRGQHTRDTWLSRYFVPWLPGDQSRSFHPGGPEGVAGR